jgi:uncharacterized protein YndB with AHSA1/START domain
MDAPLTIERDVAVDLPLDELWDLIGTAEGWQQWLVDDAAVAVLPGELGEVVDDGVRRSVGVIDVEHGRSVTFRWSEVDGDDDVSLVTLRIVEDDDGPRLRVTEHWAASACAECPLRAGGRWDLRACLLCVRAAASCHA